MLTNFVNDDIIRTLKSITIINLIVIHELQFTFFLKIDQMTHILIPFNLVINLVEDHHVA